MKHKPVKVIIEKTLSHCSYICPNYSLHWSATTSQNYCDLTGKTILNGDTLDECFPDWCPLCK